MWREIAGKCVWKQLSEDRSWTVKPFHQDSWCTSRTLNYAFPNARKSIIDISFSPILHYPVIFFGDDTVIISVFEGKMCWKETEYHHSRNWIRKLSCTLTDEENDDWFFMTPSITTKFQYINSLLFSFFTHYMFRPPWAILKWDIQLVIISVFEGLF
jgi:hypothetical protein